MQEVEVVRFGEDDMVGGGGLKLEVGVSRLGVGYSLDSGGQCLGGLGNKWQFWRFSGGVVFFVLNFFGCWQVSGCERF